MMDLRCANASVPKLPQPARLPELGQRLGDCNQFVLHQVGTNASPKNLYMGDRLIPVMFARPFLMM